MLPWTARFGLLAPLVSLGLVSSALARPGGGHTFGGGDDYSGGGGGGGGGGDGDGGAELIWLLIRLVFYYPKVGIPLVVIVLLVMWRFKNARPEAWATSHVARPPARVPRGLKPRADLAALRQLDPDFSRVIFEDFCYRLYASSYRARADQAALGALAPYLSEAVRRELVDEPPQGVPASSVVVGSLRIDQLALPQGGVAGFVELSVHYETNVTLGALPDARTLYRRERWTLRRAADARTKPPEETERLGCPNCGAPFASSDGRRCAYCNQVVEDGRFAWQVTRRILQSSQARPPALTSDVEERGTDRPTVYDPALATELAALTQRDPATTPEAIEARARLIYAQLNSGWSARDLSGVRGLVSDGMYDYLRYWIEAYQAQGLVNVLENMQLARVELVKLVRDRHFDALTLRLWASGLDYTVEAQGGRLISGSRTAPRRYSEYWTLIRAAAVRGAPRTDASCPNCAAPLVASMAGQCTHCGAHITRGEFDWVLSKIEQDDVYEG